MNKLKWSRNIILFSLAVGIIGLGAYGYIIYTAQINKIGLLEENLGTVHQALKKAKDKFSETNREKLLLSEEKNDLAENIVLQKKLAMDVREKKEDLGRELNEISLKKKELESKLKKTEYSLQKEAGLYKSKEKKLEKDFLKKLQSEKETFAVQEEVLAKQIEALEVMLKSLREKNNKLLGKLDKAGREVAELSKDKIAGNLKDARSKLTKKINTLDAALKENKKLIRENEKISGELKEKEEKLKKETLRFHYNLALTYDESHRYKEAVSEYKKALKVDPDDADIHYNLAVVYDEQIHDRKKAIRHYESYLKLRPDAEDTYKVTSWISKAKEELEWGKLKLLGGSK